MYRSRCSAILAFVSDLCICTCVIGGELTTEVLEADSASMALDLVQFFHSVYTPDPF